jgi:hypothetical protein
LPRTHSLSAWRIRGLAKAPLRRERGHRRVLGPSRRESRDGMPIGAGTAHRCLKGAQTAIHAAAWWYSCSRPPSRSRRYTSPVPAQAIGSSWRWLCGVANPSPRCGRWRATPDGARAQSSPRAHDSSGSANLEPIGARGEGQVTIVSCHDERLEPRRRKPLCRPSLRSQAARKHVKRRTGEGCTGQLAADSVRRGLRCLRSRGWRLLGRGRRLRRGLARWRHLAGGRRGRGDPVPRLPDPREAVPDPASGSVHGPRRDLGRRRRWVHGYGVVAAPDHRPKADQHEHRPNGPAKPWTPGGHCALLRLGTTDAGTQPDSLTAPSMTAFVRGARLPGRRFWRRTTDSVADAPNVLGWRELNTYFQVTPSHR